MNLRAHGIFRAALGLALHAVIDRGVEVGVDLEQQRIGVFDIEGDDIFVLDLDVLRTLETRHRGIEGAQRAQFERPVPGPAHILGGELVAPIALDALAQLEHGALAARVEFPTFRQLADHVDAARLVGMKADILAQGTRHFLVGDLLEAEQAVIERGNGLERTQADIEVAVEALRRCRSGDHQGRAGLGEGSGHIDDARHDRGGRGCRRGLKKVASVELRSLKAQDI